MCAKTESSLKVQYSTYGNIICEWKLDASPNPKVALEISNVRLPTCSDCSCGNVEVYDGVSSLDSKIWSWCKHSKVLSYSVLSDGPSLFIEFTVGPDSVDHGFEATFIKLKENRGIILYTRHFIY